MVDSSELILTIKYFKVVISHTPVVLQPKGGCSHGTASVLHSM